MDIEPAINASRTAWAVPGQPLAAAVAAAIRELQGADPLAEVLVVVPPGATAGTLRRLLPVVSGGVAGLRFVTPIDLAVELVDAAVSTQRAVTPHLHMAAIHSVLSGPTCPALLQPVRSHPATVQALVEMATSLRAAHTSPPALSAIAGDPTSVRAALLQVVTQARALLIGLGIRDESATLAALATVGPHSLADLAAVVVVTDTFHPAQLDFVSTITSSPATRVVAVPPHPNDTMLQEQLLALGCGRGPVVAPTQLSVVSCPDPDEEVRWVVRRCAALIDGTDGSAVPADEIAIACTAGLYRRAVRDELQRAGIAWSGAAIEQLRGSIAGQVLGALIDGTCHGWTRQRVSTLLSVAPVYPFTDSGVPRRISQWTSICRRIGLVAEADWQTAAERLLQHHHRDRAYRARYGDDPDEPTVRQRSEIKALDSLLTLVRRLQVQSRQVRTAARWRDAADGITAMLADHIGTSLWRETAWIHTPAWQRHAAEQVERVVTELAEFDHDGVAVPFGQSVLQHSVVSLLEQPVRRRGEASGSVAIVDIAAGVCLPSTHVFVLGANEGQLPPTATDDLLLGRDVTGSAAAVVEGPSHRVARSERGWYGLSASPAVVTATWARTDLRRGGEMYPSPLIAAVEAARHPSHEHGVLSDVALTAAEHLMRAGGLDDAASGSARLARRARAVRSRLDPEPTDYDGIIGTTVEVVAPPRGWAVTAIEKHAVCGLNSFGALVLGVREETDAVTITSIEPIDRGNLVHHVFEQLAKEWLAIAPPDRPPWLQGEHLSTSLSRATQLLDVEAARLGSLNRLGHDLAWQAERRVILAGVSATLEQESAAGSQPLSAEHNFEGVIVGDVPFTGKIDRVDLLGGGQLQVTDFKTGKASISAADPLAKGTKLQLPLYAAVADQHRAALLAEGGVDDMYDQAPPAATRYLAVSEGVAKPHVLELSAEVQAQFRAAIDHWVDELTSGVFAPRPASSRYPCPMCAPDSLGGDDLAERSRNFTVNQFSSTWGGVVEVPDGD